MLLASLAHLLEEIGDEGSGFLFLERELARLGIDGFRLEWVEKKVAGIRTWHVDVVQTTEQPLRTHSDLLRIVNNSRISGRASKWACDAVTLLGEAEAKVHGVVLEDVHFHEIGAVDTIVDIVGTMVLIDTLKVESIHVSPIDLGSGFVLCAHGKMPVPAPACAELAKGLTAFGSACGMERATPTGLAVLRTVADTCGSMPMGEVCGVGYGSGGRSSDEQPTYVRAFLLRELKSPCLRGRVRMRDNVKVIIARYQEDIAWADGIGYDYVVYDKGCNLENCISLENIGRESHTYLTHIVRNYDTLAEVNVFLQGNPFDHLSDQGNGSVTLLRTMIDEVVERQVPFKGFAWFKLKCDRLGRPHDLYKPENEGRWAGWGKDIPLGEVFEKLFDASFPQQLVVRAPAGIFAVTGERIRTRPKGFYEYALRLIEQDPDDSNNTGHAFERLWQHIFNGNVAWNKKDYSELT